MSGWRYWLQWYGSTENEGRDNETPRLHENGEHNVLLNVLGQLSVFVSDPDVLLF